jgi:hypothetical protein
MKAIFFNGHVYKCADLSDCDVNATLETTLRVMSPIIIVNEIADAQYLLPDIEIKEDHITYTLK